MQRAWRTWHEQGPASVLWKSLWDLGVYRRCVVTYNVRKRDRPRRYPRLQLLGGLLTLQEADAYVRFRPDQDAAEIAGRLKAGDRCYIVWDRARIVGCSWTTLRRIWLDFLRCEIEPAADATYTFDEFVLPEYRRHRILRNIYFERRNDMLDIGRTRSLGIIWLHNASALARHELGRSPSGGMIGYARVGPWVRHFLRWNPAVIDLADPPMRIVTPPTIATLAPLPAGLQRRDRQAAVRRQHEEAELQAAGPAESDAAPSATPRV